VSLGATKGASTDLALTGVALTGSQDSKGAKATTGSDSSDFPKYQPEKLLRSLIHREAKCQIQRPDTLED